jgi:hypothetical protein
LTSEWPGVTADGDILRAVRRKFRDSGKEVQGDHSSWISTKEVVEIQIRGTEEK